MVRANRKARRLNTRLLNAVQEKDHEELKSCLQDGASPNSTCYLVQISACHAAAYANPDALDILLKRDAVRSRKDAYGRTPLHVAAWAGNDLAIEMLLNIPRDFLNKKGILKGTDKITLPTKVIKSAIIDVQCELDHDPEGEPIPKLADLPKSCMDSLEHKCGTYFSHIPKFNTGWTPLHVASYAANHSTTELLLAAGANPNSRDAMGQTPLDVAGAACYLETHEVVVENYVETIKILIKYCGQLNTTECSIESNCFSALHTAVELCSIEAIEELLAVGASVTHHNARGNTPLHECVMKGYEEPLKLLVNHGSTNENNPTVDVTNASGHTALHMAIQYSWIPGVCIALDAGADVTLKANDGTTAVHIAALEGNVSILREILENVHDKSTISDEDGRRSLEAPLLCAMRSGSLDCVRMIIEAGAPLYVKICKTAINYNTLVEILKNAAELNTNQLIHAATDIGHINILRYLLDQDKNLEKLLRFRCIHFYSKTPVEYTILCIKKNCDKKETYLNMLKFLLNRTPEIENFDPAIAASIVDIPDNSLDNEIIEELLKVDSRALDTDSPVLLHQAILGLNEEMVLKLIKNGADLSAVLGDTTATSRLMSYHPKATEFLARIYDSCIYSNEYPVNHKLAVITINYRVLVPTQEEPLERMKVLKALLDTGNRRGQRKLLAHVLVETYILWNWKAFSWFFFVLFFAYSLFVSSLSVYVVSVFYYKDTKEPALTFFSPFFWQFPVYFTVVITGLLELSYTNISSINWKSYIFWFTLLMKLGTYSLPMSIPPVITIESSNAEWRRYLASFTLMLAWMNLMLLISSTPVAGLLIQMFWKVTRKLIRILFSFSLLIFMFSFIFMVQFHTEEPFDGPSAAIFKTLVMMTSEFDYEDNFGDSKSNLVNIQVLRFIFLVFLLLVAIVIMNLMTGVAVNDVQELVEDSTLRRLETQVYLMNDLESAMKYNPIFKFLRLHILFQSAKSPKKIEIHPSFGIVDVVPILPKGPRSKKLVYIQGHEIEPFMDAILDKAREQFDKESQKAVSIENESQLKEIHKIVTSKSNGKIKTQVLWENALKVVVKRNKKAKKTDKDTVNVSSNGED